MIEYSEFFVDTLGPSSSAPTPPAMQSAVPGTVATAPPAPAAPGEPFPWAFVVFGVLGVALLIAWFRLSRRGD